MTADGSRAPTTFVARPRRTARAVLFDLDGTLADTAPDLAFAANRVREELDLEPLPIEGYRPLASGGARGLLGHALGITPEDPHYGLRVERFLVHYRANLSRASRLFPGMDELLHYLERNGRPWGIVTNKASALTEPLVADLGLASRAACVISADQVARPKPAPDSLLLALERLGLGVDDAVYVGDDPRDIEAARAAGLRSVAANWGYLGSSGPVETWRADAIVDSVPELRELLD